MRKHGRIYIIALAVVIAAILSLIHWPKQLQGTMTVSTGTGETSDVEFYLSYYRSLILPNYVKGTIYIDGVEYTDRHTKLKEFPGMADNCLFPSAWWKTKESIPYNMTFVRSDCLNIIQATQNQIDVLNIVLEKDGYKIGYVYLDERNLDDSNIHGVNFWGPAQNADEAARVAIDLGYEAP